MIVPLPPPEGELTTKRVPRGLVAFVIPVAGCSSFTLLDILNLLAEFFDLCFDCQPSFLDYQISRLGKSGVRFTVQFLQEKVEHLSRFTRGIECFLELSQVTAQTHHLLADVAAVGEVRDLLGQPRRIYLHYLSATLEQLPDPFLQTQAVSVGESGRGGFDRG